MPSGQGINNTYMDYCESTSTLCVSILITSTRHVGMGLTKTTWVKLYCLWVGGRGFHLCSNRIYLLHDCSLIKPQIMLYQCVHLSGTLWCTKNDVLVKKPNADLLPASDLGNAAAWGSKRINPRPHSCNL